jgi:large subunit ribosomal protein L15
VVHPENFAPGVKLANPTARKDIEYYRDPEHRGYLSDTLNEGESPSLFWIESKVKGQGLTKEQVEKRKAKQTNRLF